MRFTTSCTAKRRLLDMCRQAAFTMLLAAGALALSMGGTRADAASITLVIIGDSLSAGYGLPKEAAFPTQLERRLRDKGYDIRVVNSGVSGDTTKGGRARLAWALGDNPDAVLLELGANDALRGLEPEQAYENLKAILTTLQAKRIPVLLAGMRAPPNMGEDYAKAFDDVYTRLDQAFDVVFYPFFLAGVAAIPALNQDDGIHPNAQGVAVVVDNILPSVEQLLARTKHDGS
jgi:acyl-CoA thioesterase-1